MSGDAARGKSVLTCHTSPRVWGNSYSVQREMENKFTHTRSSEKYGAIVMD